MPLILLSFLGLAPCRQENQSYGNPGNSAHLALPLAGYHLVPGLNRHLPDERPDPLILK
jgi:hypothetical protein